MPPEDRRAASFESTGLSWEAIALMCGFAGLLAVGVLALLPWKSDNSPPDVPAAPAAGREDTPLAKPARAGADQAPSEQGRNLSRQLPGHEKPVVVVSVSPSGDRILSADAGGTILVGDFFGGDRLAMIETRDFPLCHASFSANLEFVIACAKDPTIRAWSTKSGGPVREFAGHTAEVTAVRPIPRTGRFLSSSFDSSLIVWDLQTGEPVRRFGTATNARELMPLTVDNVARLNGHSTWIRDAVVLPDGRRAISAGNDLVLFVWDIETGSLLGRLIEHPAIVLGLSHSPDGRYVAAVGSDKTVTVWNIAEKKVVQCWSHSSEKPPAVAFASDSQAVAVAGDDGAIHLFEIHSAEELSRLELEGVGVASLVFTANDELVCGCLDGTIRIWPKNAMR